VRGFLGKRDGRAFARVRESPFLLGRGEVFLGKREQFIVKSNKIYILVSEDFIRYPMDLEGWFHGNGNRK
jgi:hypothetical protein